MNGRNAISLLFRQFASANNPQARPQAGRLIRMQILSRICMILGPVDINGRVA
jgi:hypothetical protein